MRTFKVSDTLDIEAYPPTTDLPIRHLVIRFSNARPYDVIYLSEITGLIAQIVEATLYLTEEQYYE